MVNQMPMSLFWMKCDNNAWCSLNSVDLSHSYYDNFEGIYVIWYWDDLGEPVTVRVGQGNLRERFAAHRKDHRIQRYAHLNLLVTWTGVPSSHLDGVEAYLGKVLKPKVGSLFPNPKPIPVTLPFLINPPLNKIDRHARPY